MISTTYRISEDKYFRGNGRWAKVVSHCKRREDGKYEVEFSVACDYEGVYVSHRPIYRYNKRSRAESIAKDWIEYEG